MNEEFKCPYCEMLDHYVPLVKATRSEEELEMVIAQIIDEASCMGSVEVLLNDTFLGMTCDGDCEDFCDKCMNDKDYQC